MIPVDQITEVYNTIFPIMNATIEVCTAFLEN
jgi:hypothetical protein